MLSLPNVPYSTVINPTTYSQHGHPPAAQSPRVKPALSTASPPPQHRRTRRCNPSRRPRTPRAWACTPPARAPARGCTPCHGRISGRARHLDLLAPPPVPVHNAVEHADALSRLPKKSSSMGMRSACARSHRTHAALCCSTTARGCSRALALELRSAALCRDFFTGGVGAGVTRNRGGVAIVTCSRMCVSGNSRATVSG